MKQNRIPKCEYIGTQKMLVKKKKGDNTVIHFVEYRNLPTGGWGTIKKYNHGWYSDDERSVSVVRYHDKKKLTLISTKHHGSSMDRAARSRGGSKKVVEIPAVVKHYSNGKVGVDVGDQRLRDKRAFADTIKSSGWSRKWAMHGIQQIRHQAFLCWADLHKLKDGSEVQCKQWASNGIGNGKVNWAFNIGLIKGMLAHISSFTRANEIARNRRGTIGDELLEHTIVNRGRKYKNVRCAVCTHERRIGLRGGRKGATCSQFWCPHPDCRAHVCEAHRNSVHEYAKMGIILAHYHKEKRIEYTAKNPGKQKANQTSGIGWKSRRRVKYDLEGSF